MMGSTCIYRTLMTFDYFMGWVLTWALIWAMSGPGPQPRPLRPIECGGLRFSLKFIGVVGLGFNLTRCARVVGLDRLLA